jgi:hypothetical protein
MSLSEEQWTCIQTCRGSKTLCTQLQRLQRSQQKAGIHRKMEKAKRNPSFLPLEGPHPCQCLGSRLLTPGLPGNKYPFLLAISLWYSFNVATENECSFQFTEPSVHPLILGQDWSREVGSCQVVVVTGCTSLSASPTVGSGAIQPL